MSDRFDPIDDLGLLDDPIEPPAEFRSRLRAQLVASFEAGSTLDAASEPTLELVSDAPVVTAPRSGARHTAWLAAAAVLVLLLGIVAARSLGSGDGTNETDQPELIRPAPTELAAVCAAFEMDVPTLVAIESGSVTDRVDAIRTLALAVDVAAADLTRLGLISGGEQQSLRLVTGSLNEAGADLDAGALQAASAAIDFAFAQLDEVLSVELGLTAEGAVCG